MTHPEIKPLLLYVVTDDWFFVSHFLPMARAARAAGFQILIAGRMDRCAKALADEGFQTFDTVEDRRSGGLWPAVRVLLRLRKIMRDQRPDIVHLVALRSVMLGELAHRLSGSPGQRVLAVTGLGFLGTTACPGWKRLSVFALVRWLGQSSRSRFLFENPSDELTLDLPAAARARAVIVGGAGIDPQSYRVDEPPKGGTFRLALVSRMIWSKGVDLAIDAIARARKRGVDVRLSLYGMPDAGNPANLPLSELQALDGRDGVTWNGKADDVRTVWAAHHACILPSRGGEGLPRVLLEAAACGRAIITTDVAGCRDFVRHQLDGLVVPPSDASALAEAIVELARHPGRVAAMGASAHRRVLDGYTEADVTAAVVGLYRQMLTDRGHHE